MMTPRGPFALSLSKGLRGFDKLSPNGRSDPRKAT
jgi:hypothetical protein